MITKEIRFLVWLFSCAVLLFCSTNIAMAATYYVALNGNDNNPGTIDAPWLTYTKAGSLAGPGDTVYFRAGTYEITGVPFRPANSGTPGNPITFAAYPDETVTLHGDVGNQTIHIDAKNYIIIDGFIISSSNAARCGPEMNITGTHITVQNCQAIGHGWPGGTNCAAFYIPRGGCDDCLFQNNLITDYYAEGSGVNTTGLMMYSSDNTIIKNNSFVNCEKGMYIKEGNDGIDISKNLFYDSEDGAGIYVLGSVYQKNINISQNIIINGGFYGILLYDGGGPLENINIYNNTIYNNSQGVSWPTGPNTRNIQAWNNIYSTNRGDRVARTENLVYQDFNAFYNNNRISDNAVTLAEWQEQTTFDDNSVSTRQDFINPGGSDAKDYKRTSYPTNGRGGSYASVMGAYITGNEVIGCSEGASPPPPPPPPPSPPSSPPNFSANN